MLNNYLDPVYVHLKKESFVNSSLRKDSMGAYTEKAIRQNYAEAAAQLEDKGFSQFGDNISIEETQAIIDEYQALFIRKQGESIFKEIEKSLADTVNSFTYGNNKKLTGRKQTKKGVLDDIGGYLSALNNLIAEYNQIDENLLNYLNSKKGKGKKIFVKPENGGLFSLSKAETGRGAKALQEIIALRDEIAKGSASVKKNTEITKIIRKNLPGWLNILKGDVEEGIDAIVAETMFDFYDTLGSELKATAVITGEDKILMDDGRAKNFINRLGPKKKEFNVAKSGFTAKSDTVTAFYAPDGSQMGLIGNSIKSYRVKNGKNVTLSGTTVLNATAISDLIETPFDYLYLNNLVHNESEMFGAVGSENILNRYLASKISVFILAGYTGKAATSPLFLTYLNKILYLPEVLRQGSLNRGGTELFISVLHNKKLKDENQIVEKEGVSDYVNAKRRSAQMVNKLRKIKIAGGFRGSAIK